MTVQSTYRGRFAPSPTGPLHLGSLATAVASYLDAKIHHGTWLIRIEDIDHQRCKPEWTSAIFQALQAHGLHSDQPPIIQSQRQPRYAERLSELTAQQLTYPCCCTRKDIDQANAHRQFGQNRIYPGTCRQGMPIQRSTQAIRFYCPKTPMHWSDWRLGDFQEDLQHTSGDYVLLRADGEWAYHLAVVVDDLDSEITHIVRGEDLADTTARQVALYQAFKHAAPAYWHLPVILANDGQKLSKQTGATALNLTTPCDNLNQIAAHFGLPSQQANTPDDWLQQATNHWANYRKQQAPR